ncbi:MAG: hypothetical protein M3015_06655 [Bacteroidota bacterium]|nr:hypothetical protein [Bacteroidota bacterium]
MRTAPWYENIKFSNDFRIDFGNPDSGNAVIFKNNEKEEGLFENHVKLNGGYSESLLYFYVNDKLIQVENITT